MLFYYNRHKKKEKQTFIFWKKKKKKKKTFKKKKKNLILNITLPNNNTWFNPKFYPNRLGESIIDDEDLLSLKIKIF